MLEQLENLNKQLTINTQIDTIMAQSLKLMDIVNANQKQVNELKKEWQLLKTHTDNATDSIAS
jgi:hypothetical protein